MWCTSHTLSPAISRHHRHHREHEGQDLHPLLQDGSAHYDAYILKLFRVCVVCVCVGFQYTVEELSTEDKITLCIIRNYLDFKVTTQ